MNKISINERELRQSIRKHLIEQDSEKDQKPRCVAGNVIPLDMMIGPSDKFGDYTSSVLKRDGGINGMVDTLDVLRTLRLHNGIEDSGEHLSYNLMNHINTFRNKNYFDETNNECQKAMDKVIELYKEKSLDVMLEIPLMRWVDKGNSKVKYSYFFKLFLDLYRIKNKYKQTLTKNKRH